MKVVSGELILTIVTIVGLGLVGFALYKFAPEMTESIFTYMKNFFSKSPMPGATGGFGTGSITL